MAAEATVLVPKWLFKNSDGSPCEIKTQYRSLTGGATNALVIAAATGKRIRILSMHLALVTASPSYVTFKDGSAGSALALVNVPPVTNGANYTLDPNAIGWMDSSSGVGIYADIGAETVKASFRYIEYA